MVRDRTLEFQRKSGTLERNARPPTDDVDEPDFNTESDELLSKEHWKSVDDFLKQVTAVQKELEAMEDLLGRIKDIHGKLLISPGVDKDMSEKLAVLYDKFNASYKKVHGMIKGIDEEAKELAKAAAIDSTLSVDSRIKTNQSNALVKKLHTLVTRYNAEQSEYKEKSHKAIAQYLRIKGVAMSDDDIADAVEHGDLEQKTMGIFLAVEDKKALYEDVRSRKDELLRLEKSIRELSDMFKDLQLLVQSQGEMMDHIEHNVESAVEYAEKAKKNVIDARELQKSARKKKIFIAIVLAILVIILIIILQGMVCHFTPIC